MKHYARVTNDGSWNKTNTVQPVQTAGHSREATHGDYKYYGPTIVLSRAWGLSGQHQAEQQHLCQDIREHSEKQSTSG